MTEPRFDRRDVGPGGVCMMPDSDCGPLSTELWRESPLPDDPVLLERRLRIKKKIFEAAFGTPQEQRLHGRKILPFTELPQSVTYLMPPSLRVAYDAELATAQDPRSGRIVRTV